MRFALLFTVAVVLIMVTACGVGFVIYANSQQKFEPPKIETQTVRRELLVFGGPWCEPCVKMRKIVDQVRGTNDVTDIDPQSGEQMAREAEMWHVTDCPTFIAIENANDRMREVARFTGEMSADELLRLVKYGEVPLREPTQVLDLPQPDLPQPLRVRSIVTSNAGDDKPAEGAQGWRLRLFYPRGDAEGERLQAALGRMTNVASKYGFESETTDTERFRKSWRPYGYPRDKITIVLVRDDNTVVYYQHKFPADVKRLRDDIRAAAAGDKNLAAEFEREIGGKERIKER